MAIDSADKRRAAAALSSGLSVAAPVPDSDLSALDRRHVAGYYRLETLLAGGGDLIGIVAAGPAVTGLADSFPAVHGEAGVKPAVTGVVD